MAAQTYVQVDVTIGMCGGSKRDICHLDKAETHSSQAADLFLKCPNTQRATTHPRDSEFAGQEPETLSKNSNRLRPCCLARYKAASAWERRTASSATPPSGRPATPKLAVKLSEGAKPKV